ncbi:MAG: hypothetical protein WCL04_01660 [Verrucomicrobiota bacterium]
MDKILFVLSVFLVGGAYWLVDHQQEQAREVVDRTQAPTVVSAYVPVDVKVALDPAQEWRLPHAQDSGPSWVYEVFTSPYLRIYHGEITADPPIALPGKPPFGLAYEGIKPDLFRLQLVGVTGQDVIFWNVRDNKVIRTHESMKLPDLGVEILGVEMKRVDMGEPVTGGGRTPSIIVPRATLLDTKTNTKIEVSGQEKAMGGEPFAILKVTAGPKKGDPKKNVLPPMKAGTTFEENGATYHVDSVTGDPTPSIVVTKMVPGEANNTQTLAPKPQAAEKKK